jgi:hypothetical protein
MDIAINAKHVFCVCGLSQICALTAYGFTLRKESWRHLVLICLICLAHIETQERVAIFATRQEGHQNYHALLELIGTSSSLLPSDTAMSVKHQQANMKTWAYFFKTTQINVIRLYQYLYNEGQNTASRPT